MNATRFFAENQLYPWLLPENTFDAVTETFAAITKCPETLADYQLRVLPFIRSALVPYYSSLRQIEAVSIYKEVFIEDLLERIVEKNALILFLFQHLKKSAEEKTRIGPITVTLGIEIERFVMRKRASALKMRREGPEYAAFHEQLAAVHREVVASIRALMLRRSAVIISPSLKALPVFNGEFAKWKEQSRKTAFIRIERPDDWDSQLQAFSRVSKPVIPVDFCAYSAIGTFPYDSKTLKENLGDTLVSTECLIDLREAVLMRLLIE